MLIKPARKTNSLINTSKKNKEKHNAWHIMYSYRYVNWYVNGEMMRHKIQQMLCTIEIITLLISQSLS